MKPNPMSRSRSSRIAADQVRPLDRPVIVGQNSAELHAPEVELVRHSPELTEIRIGCRCGEQIVLYCESPAAQEALHGARAG